MSPSIEVHGLSYKFQDGSEGLKDIELSLPVGSRTLLIGGKRHYFLPLHIVYFQALTLLVKSED